MKSNLTKSVVVLAGFALLYVLTRVPLVHVGERVVSCDSALAALLFKKGSFAYSLMKHLLSCIIPLITVAIVCKGKNILECLGLRRNFLKGWAVGLLCCIPMLVCNLIAGHVEFGWDKLFLGAVFAGLFEELIYRGFLFSVSCTATVAGALSGRLSRRRFCSRSDISINHTISCPVCRSSV